jgi:hypothetical protein
MPENMNKLSFLNPQSRYWGRFTPEDLAFNANLQEFAQKISYISALQTGGKVSSEQAYQDIKSLWKQLKKSKKELGVGANIPKTES